MPREDVIGRWWIHNKSPLSRDLELTLEVGRVVTLWQNDRLHITFTPAPDMVGFVTNVEIERFEVEP